MQIEKFKSALGAGGARPNQFEVILTFPTAVGAVGGDANILVTGREVKMAGERIFDPWTITIANDTKQSLRQPFEAWLDAMNNKADNSSIALNPQDYQREITVKHLDRNDEALPGGIIQLNGAFPINMSEVALQYAQNDIIEEFTVTFQYQDYEVIN